VRHRLPSGSMRPPPASISCTCARNARARAAPRRSTARAICPTGSGAVSPSAVAISAARACASALIARAPCRSDVVSAGAGAGGAAVSPSTPSIVMSCSILCPLVKGRRARHPRRTPVGVPPGACPGARGGLGARRARAFCRVYPGPSCPPRRAGDGSIPPMTAGRPGRARRWGRQTTRRPAGGRAARRPSAGCGCGPHVAYGACAGQR
jgi:hypothetical protein